MVRRPLMVGRVLRGRKVATIGTTAEKSFEILYDRPCPALEASLHAQPIIWYFAVPFGCLFSFACADHMYTPVGGRAPSVHPRAPYGSPRVLRLLGGAVLVLVFAGLSCAISCRVLRVRWCACRCLSAFSGG